MWTRFWGLVIVCLAMQVSTVGVAQSTACPSPNDLPPRLEPDIWARVQSDSPNNLRADAGLNATIIGKLPSGDIFRVLDGPRCADGYVWWQVDYAATTGWTAEGSAANADYWLEPLDSIENSTSGTTEPQGCLKPPEVYDRLEVNFTTVNLRTLAMLDHAQELYDAEAEGGVVHFRTAIMQGSYNPGGVSASFGTHDGGGALDISVRDPISYDVLTDQIPLMLRALRVAGFAAWLRDFNELYAGSPIHIHAIAVGDAELSEAARGQLDGAFGYFLGYNGLPQDSGIPLSDTSGEMVVCGWMVEMGFHDLRS